MASYVGGTGEYSKVYPCSGNAPIVADGHGSYPGAKGCSTHVADTYPLVEDQGLEPSDLGLRLTSDDVIRASTYNALLAAIISEKARWNQDSGMIQGHEVGVGTLITKAGMRLLRDSLEPTAFVWTTDDPTPEWDSSILLSNPSVDIKAEAFAVQFNELRDRVHNLQATCTCNCNYCTCNCNYCTCNCHYSCTCNCNY